MNFSLVLLALFTLFSSVLAVDHGEIQYHRISKRQFNFGRWGRNMGQRGENYGRGWGQQW